MKKTLLKIVEKELAYFAHLTYLKFRPFVVGVTGSSGKTTVRYMIYSLVAASGKNVKSSQENLNTETGLPLAVLGYNKAPDKSIGWLWIFIKTPLIYLLTFKYPEVLVLEYAADKPGDISYLANIIPPDIAVITNFGVAHIEAFKTINKIIEEKWKLSEIATQIVICPKRVIDKVTDRITIRAKILVAGEKNTAKAENVKFNTNGTEFDLYLLGKKFSVKFPFWGAHNISNIEIASLAAASVVGDNKKVANAILALELQSGRGRRFMASKDILVIDESYNANPLSLAAALNNLKQAQSGRKVAIIGEMKEIKPISKVSHEEIARLAKQTADLVIGVGDKFEGLGLDMWYPNVEELSYKLDSILQSGDVVLVKGSHSVKLDKIVKKLE